MNTYLKLQLHEDAEKLFFRANQSGVKNDELTLLKDKLENSPSEVKNIDHEQKILDLVLGLCNKGNLLAARNEGRKYLSEISSTEGYKYEVLTVSFFTKQVAARLTY